jgi:hypothetical protein
MSRKKTENVYNRQIGAYVNFRYSEFRNIPSAGVRSR